MRDGRRERWEHTHRIALLDETLVVPAEGDEEEDGGDVLEAVDPFPALGLLAADIDHDEPLLGRAGHGEVHLGDAHRARAGEDDVLAGWRQFNIRGVDTTQKGRRTPVVGTYVGSKRRGRSLKKLRVGR
jgi:hypothetical protein